MEINFCPLCGGDIEIEVKKRIEPIELKVICQDACGEYVMAGDQSELLATIGEKGRSILSRYVRGTSKNWGLTTLRSGHITRIIGAYQAAERVISKFGLSGARVEHSGEGFDSLNPLFFVEQNGERFSLRVHHRNEDELEIRSKSFWLTY